MLCAKSKQAKSNSVSLKKIFFLVILNYVKVFRHISFETINLGALSQKKKNKKKTTLKVTS